MARGAPVKYCWRSAGGGWELGAGRLGAGSPDEGQGRDSKSWPMSWPGLACSEVAGGSWELALHSTGAKTGDSRLGPALRVMLGFGGASTGRSTGRGASCSVIGCASDPRGCFGSRLGSLVAVRSAVGNAFCSACNAFCSALKVGNGFCSACNAFLFALKSTTP